MDPNVTLSDNIPPGFPRLATRSIRDFCIPDDALKPDSEHAKRADDSAMELSRLSLLGIAGYGFLLKGTAMAGGSGLAACQKYAWCLISGAALLAVATSCALATRELSVRCSTLQIAILRTFTKLENGGWSDSEVSILKLELENYRVDQRNKLKVARQCLRIAHLSLAAGAVLTVVSFGLILNAVT